MRRGNVVTVSFWLLFLMGALAPCLIGCDGSPPGNNDGQDTGATTCGAGEVERLGADGCCQAGEKPVADGRCLPAGVQANGCAAGEVPVNGGSAEGGTCRAAGIPPEMCGEGFDPDGAGGCKAILPDAPCPVGKMAIPGETECRAVAPCGQGKWGDIPLEPSTVFVDGSYSGENGSSDGSMQRPWAKIQEGIDAATADAIVAVAAGSYNEDLKVLGQPVRIWGRCPGVVEVVGSDSALAAVVVGEGAEGSVVHGVSLTGPARGLLVLDAADVHVQETWVHDTGDSGIDVENGKTRASAVVERSLVEAAGGTGIFVLGADVSIEESSVRATSSIDSAGAPGRGINSQFDKNTKFRAHLSVGRSLIERNIQSGIRVSGSDASLKAVVVRDTQPTPELGGTGWGINVTENADGGQHGALLAENVVVEKSHGQGVMISGSEATMELSVIRDTSPAKGKQDSGEGVWVQFGLASGQRGKVVLHSVIVERAHHAGAASLGSDLFLDGCVVRDTIDGVGVFALHNKINAEKAVLSVATSRIEKNVTAGVLLLQSVGHLASTLIADTRVKSGDGVAAGVMVVSDHMYGIRASIDLEGCVIEQSDVCGLLAVSSDVDVTSTVVRDSRPHPVSQQLGTGVSVYGGPTSEERSNISLNHSLIERCRLYGISIRGSDGLVDGALIRNIEPDVASGMSGEGLVLTFQPQTTERTSAVVRGSRIEGCTESGIYVKGSDVTIEKTVVAETSSRPADGLFGDGIFVSSEDMKATVELRACSIERSPRCGLASFGAEATLIDNSLSCNGISLCGNSMGSQPYALNDSGGNICGCVQEVESCEVKALALEAPETSEECEGPACVPM